VTIVAVNPVMPQKNLINSGDFHLKLFFMPIIVVFHGVFPIPVSAERFLEFSVIPLHHRNFDEGSDLVILENELNSIS
jgi:hypothetical protein